jgi:hypothetical protein
MVGRGIVISSFIKIIENVARRTLIQSSGRRWQAVASGELRRSE